VVLGHLGFDGDDRARNRVADLGARAAVDGRLRQMEEDVEDPRALRLAEQPVEELRVFWPDPWQGVGRREERIESRGTHHAPLAAPDRPGKTDKPSALKNDKTRAREMDHDFADAFVHAANGDVLRRKRDDLSANFIPAVVVGRDAHLVADLAPVRIVRIVLGDSLRTPRASSADISSRSPRPTPRMRLSQAATCLRAGPEHFRARVGPRPLDSGGSAARQFGAQLSMQPSLPHSSALRLRPSV
jgi:hypothetical protein